MDALLSDLQVVCSQLLPILGAAALVFLCIFLRKLAKLIESLTLTVNNLGPTLKKVDESVEKIQAPLDTVVRVSHSVDKVQDKTAEALGKVTEMANDSLNNLKDYAASRKEKNNEETSSQEDAE